MATIGFSTGALALGDFGRALEMLKAHPASAIELSALRDTELKPLMDALPSLELSTFERISVHIPSKFSTLSEGEAVDLLLPCIGRNLPIVIHPDAIKDLGCWKQFGKLVCIENMDKRKPTGRTADELEPFFAALPEARFCLDLAHAAQVDSTMSVAREMLRRYGSRLLQLHVSELDSRGHHEALSMATVYAVRRVASLLSKDVTAIIESRVPEERMEREVAMVGLALQLQPPKLLETDAFAASDLI